MNKNRCKAYSLLILIVAIASQIMHADSSVQSDDNRSAFCSLSCAEALDRVCKKIEKRFPCTETTINSLPYVITNSGHYTINKSFSFSTANGIAIDVNANDVVIEFCEEGKLSLGSNAIGIRTNTNNVKILNGNFIALTDQALAISLSSGIENWTIAGGTFRDFENAILASNFSDGTLDEDTFYQCRIGFLQTGTDSLIERFIAKNIRAKYVDPDETPCPSPFPPDPMVIAAFDARLSYALSLNGEVINSNVKDFQLNGTTLYCFKCRDCLVDNIEVDLPNMLCNFIVGIQCGGPRGAQLFNILLNPDDLTLRQGCTNCRITNVRVRGVSNPELVDQLLFTIGVAALFCSNCEITDSKAVWETGKFAGVGILESYCKNCIARRSQVEGPCLIGFHICDALSLNQFCIGSIVEDAKSRNCLIGINNVRCHAPVIRGSSVQQNNFGIIISEGATNAIVENCYLSENCVGLYFGILEQNFNCFGPLFDDFCAAPCNALAANNFFVGNTRSLLVGNDLNGDSLTLFTGNGTICTTTVCEPGTNIIIDAVDTCSGMTPVCNCVICTSSFICTTTPCECLCAV